MKGFKTLKRRMAIVLCAAMMASSVTVPTQAAPAVKETKAQEKDDEIEVFDMAWQVEGVEEKDPVFVVKKGQKNFVLGDYANAYVWSQDFLKQTVMPMSLLGEATYESKNSKIVDIDERGNITPGKLGTTEVTISVGDLQLQCTIKVVDGIDVTMPSKGLLNLAKKTMDVYGKDADVTKKNRYQLVNLVNQLEVTIDEEVESRLDDAEKKHKVFKYFYSNGLWDDYMTGANVVCCPEIGRVKAMNFWLSYEISATCPIGTAPAKLFRSKELSGQKKDITMKINRKATDNDIFGIQASSAKVVGGTCSPKQSAQFPLFIVNKKNGTKQMAMATVKKGSDTIKIKPLRGTLKKGEKYSVKCYDVAIQYDGLINSNYSMRDWLKKGKTSFVAK